MYEKGRRKMCAAKVLVALVAKEKMRHNGKSTLLNI